MKLQTPIRISSLKLDETSAEYQQIAQAAMAKVNLVTDPSLSKEQRQVLYELHMPGYIQGQEGIQRDILPSGQVLDVVQDSRNEKQKYTNSRNNSIPGTIAGKRETINGFLVDFV